jgi:ligand-binding sensor domain-containing protein
MEHLMPTLPAPVLALSQGSDDGWWAVTLDGLYLGHGEGWSLVLPRSRLPLGCSLRTVAEDSAGRLWLGTSTGLRVYDLESERLLTTGSSFSLPVSALAYQAQGETLWVGTPRGLFRLKLQGAECQIEASYSVRDSGLGADSVTALALEETPGATGLWIGTVCGLTRFWLERNER